MLYSSTSVHNHPQASPNLFSDCLEHAPSEVQFRLFLVSIIFGIRPDGVGPGIFKTVAADSVQRHNFHRPGVDLT